MLALSALVACSGPARNELTLAEKCEVLRSFCSGLPRADLKACYQAGRRGVREPKHADQCFLFYDTCAEACLSEQARTAKDGSATNKADGG